jgi:hypothetical protein
MSEESSEQRKDQNCLRLNGFEWLLFKIFNASTPKRDFLLTCELLEKQSQRIVDARYEPEAFNSWCVIVGGTPRLSIVWNGKDGWLEIQQETERIYGGQKMWDTVWVAKEARKRTDIPELAVEKLRASIANEK